MLGVQPRATDRPSPGNGGSTAVRIPRTNVATRRGSSWVPAAARRRLERLAHRQRLAVRPGRGHRAERIRDRHDPGDERDVLAGQPVEVAAAVPALVVVADAGPDRLDVGQVADDRVPEPDVLLDDRVLVGRQRRRLAQDRVRDPDLADVVEESGQLDRATRPRGRARAGRPGTRRTGRRPRSAASCSGPSCRRQRRARSGPRSSSAGRRPGRPT